MSIILKFKKIIYHHMSCFRCDGNTSVEKCVVCETLYCKRHKREHKSTHGPLCEFCDRQKDLVKCDHPNGDYACGILFCPQHQQHENVHMPTCATCDKHNDLNKCSLCETFFCEEHKHGVAFTCEICNKRSCEFHARPLDAQKRILEDPLVDVCFWCAT